MTDPGEYARELCERAHGPHDDQATAAAAGLAAETVRYLSYAATHGGLTDPATVYAVVGDLSAVAWRLPELLTQLAGWIAVRADAGKIAGDRPAGMLGTDARAIFGEAAAHAASLAGALNNAHSLAATIYATDCADQEPSADWCKSRP